MTRKELAYFINRLKLKNGVEVGVGHGGYANYLLMNTNIFLNLVDPYQLGYAEFRRSSKENTLALMSKFEGRYKLYQSESISASQNFKNGDLDFIYIDACHDYPEVKKDLEAWWPKLRSGGIFAGHDYPKAPGVKQAVDEFVLKNNLKLKTTKIVDPSMLNQELGGEEANSPSWYLIKPKEENVRTEEKEDPTNS